MIKIITMIIKIMVKIIKSAARIYLDYDQTKNTKKSIKVGEQQQQ
jgi:hypothetical protein